MSSSIQLKTTIDITSRFIYNAPLLYVNSGALAYSIGDWVRQFMLAPPFAWRWNRAAVPPIVCEPGTSDYQVTVSNFGWIEKATIVFPPNTDGNQVLYSKELEVNMALVGETRLGQPAYISPVFDDNNGNITFRLMPVPDKAYVLNILYQQSSPTFGTVFDTWSPIPDYYSYIYNQGYLAKTYEYKGDERFAFAHQEFLKQVIAASEGLSETQKNIFLFPHLIYQRETQSVSQTGAIGRQGRSGS
jgi:hypothetical protein